MYPLAEFVGFEGDPLAWYVESISLCTCLGRESLCGLDFGAFMRLVEDDSPEGCHCSNTELLELLDLPSDDSTYGWPQAMEVESSDRPSHASGAAVDEEESDVRRLAIGDLPSEEYEAKLARRDYSAVSRLVRRTCHLAEAAERRAVRETRDAVAPPGSSRTDGDSGDGRKRGGNGGKGKDCDGGKDGKGVKGGNPSADGAGPARTQ